MMEAAWRSPRRTGARPGWTEPFARTIDTAKKYVVSSTLDRVDWNAELVRGDLGKAVQQLKRESGKGLLVAGVKLPLALAELGLIDEYEFVVQQPSLVGHGPTLFAELSKRVAERRSWSPRSRTAGYVALSRTWPPGDVVTLELPMPVRRVFADERVAVATDGARWPLAAVPHHVWSNRGPGQMAVWLDRARAGRRH
jgi:dihydrofolate reductase